MTLRRSGPDLAAAIWQLEHFVSNKQELRQSYVQTKPVQFEEDPELCPANKHPELQPYKSLDAGRLKLVGEGAWPMEAYIGVPFSRAPFLASWTEHLWSSDACFSPGVQR